MPSLSKTFAKLVGRPYDEVGDRELIARFHANRDESAFAALVEKHGPMVLGLCQRRLRDSHSAEDAFQATFLVLAKKAGAVRWHDSLSGWLYAVAGNVCRKSISIRARQPLASPDTEPIPAKESTPPSDLSSVLDEELKALPAAYRDPILLCHLQGQTVEDAAKALGISEGQLRGRLFRGREKLRGRLANRGVALSISALVVSLTAASARALPLELPKITLASALGGAIPPTVHSLSHEVLSNMLRTKLQLLAASVAVAGGLIFGTGAALRTAVAGNPEPVAQKPESPLPTIQNAPKPEDDEKKEEKIDRREGIVKVVDFGKNQLVITLEQDKFDLTVELEAKSEILCGKRPHKLNELKVGMNAAAYYKGESKVAFKIEAGWPTLETTVKSLDVAKKTLGIKAEGNNGFEFEVALPLAADVNVVVDGLPSGLEDAAVGQKVWLEFAPDKKTVYGIEAEADPQDLSAQVKSLAGKSIVLTVKIAGFRDERPVDLAFEVASDAKVRYEGKDIKLADLKPEQRVRCRFAEDRKTIKAIWGASAPPKEEPAK